MRPGSTRLGPDQPAGLSTGNVHGRLQPPRPHGRCNLTRRVCPAVVPAGRGDGVATGRRSGERLPGCARMGLPAPAVEDLCPWCQHIGRRHCWRGGEGTGNSGRRRHVPRTGPRGESGSPCLTTRTAARVLHQALADQPVSAVRLLPRDSGRAGMTGEVMIEARAGARPWAPCSGRCTSSARRSSLTRADLPPPPAASPELLSPR